MAGAAAGEVLAGAAAGEVLAAAARQPNSDNFYIQTLRSTKSSTKTHRRGRHTTTAREVLAREVGAREAREVGAREAREVLAREATQYTSSSTGRTPVGGCSKAELCRRTRRH